MASAPNCLRLPTMKTSEVIASSLRQAISSRLCPSRRSEALSSPIRELFPPARTKPAIGNMKLSLAKYLIPSRLATDYWLLATDFMLRFGQFPLLTFACHGPAPSPDQRSAHDAGALCAQHRGIHADRRSRQLPASAVHGGGDGDGQQRRRGNSQHRQSSRPAYFQHRRHYSWLGDCRICVGLHYHFPGGRRDHQHFLEAQDAEANQRTQTALRGVRTG